MDRGDRAPVGSFFVEAALEPGRVIELSERANQHARVKRIEAGAVVRLVDGAGVAAIGIITALTRSAGRVEISDVTHAARPAGMHLRAPIGDRDRMLWLGEKATELGVESWQGVMYHRSRSVSPRGEGAAFAEKLRARMISALEQSGGVWLPRILPDAEPDSIDVPAGATRIMLDVEGRPLWSVLSAAPLDATVITLGPEGGFEPSEHEDLVQRGWKAARLASTTLRFETAGVAAMSVVRASHLLQES